MKQKTTTEWAWGIDTLTRYLNSIILPELHMIPRHIHSDNRILQSLAYLILILLGYVMLKIWNLTSNTTIYTSELQACSLRRLCRVELSFDQVKPPFNQVKPPFICGKWERGGWEEERPRRKSQSDIPQKIFWLRSW